MSWMLDNGLRATWRRIYWNTVCKLRAHSLWPFRSRLASSVAVMSKENQRSGYFTLRSISQLFLMPPKKEKETSVNELFSRLQTMSSTGAVACDRSKSFNPNRNDPSRSSRELSQVWYVPTFAFSQTDARHVAGWASQVWCQRKSCQKITSMQIKMFHKGKLDAK